MAKCNHSSAVTPFCPLCGESLTASPIEELAQYLVKTLAKQKTDCEKVESKSPGHYQNKYHPKTNDELTIEKERATKQARKSVEKWTQRVQALAELREQAAGNS